MGKRSKRIDINPVISICRLCTLKSDTCINVLDRYNENLLKQIQETLRIQITREDKSTDVCYSCRTKVERYHKFYTNVQNAQMYFTEIDIGFNFKVEPFQAVKMEEAEQESLINNEPDNINPLEEKSNATCSAFEIGKHTPSIKEEYIRYKNLDREDQLTIIDEFYKSYECARCKEQFKKYGEYTEHVRSNHQNMRARITCCNVFMSTAAGALSHIDYHKNPERMKCRYCEKICFHYNFLKNHEYSHRLLIKNNDPNSQLMDKRYKCDYCYKEFPSPINLNLHLKRVHKGILNLEEHEQDPIEIENIAEYGFEEISNDDVADKNESIVSNKINDDPFDVLSVRQDLGLKDMREHEKFELIDKFYKKFICNQCQLTFNHFQDYRTHTFRSHKIKTPTVSCCHLKMAKLSNIVSHIKYHDNPNLLRCYYCTKVCSHVNALKSHEWRHRYSANGYRLDDTVFECEICHKILKNRLTWRAHMATHRAKRGTKDYVCDICNSRFYTKNNIHTHMKHLHLPQIEFPCSVCGKIFRNRQRFQAHFRTTHGERVPCLLCGISLKERALKKHMRLTHPTAEDACNCDVCGMKFTSRERMRRHYNKIHKEWTNECKVCTERFFTSQSLKEHIASKHLGVTLYGCDMCSYRNNDKRNMVKHRQSKHSNEPKVPVKEWMHIYPLDVK